MSCCVIYLIGNLPAYVGFGWLVSLPQLSDSYNISFAGNILCCRKMAKVADEMPNAHLRIHASRDSYYTARALRAFREMNAQQTARDTSLYISDGLLTRVIELSS